MTVSAEALEAFLATLKAEVADPRAGINGPHSVSWKIDREAVVLLGGGRAALLQLAHPFVAHAIDQHSETQSDPIGRFRRTFENVFAMVFGDLDHALDSARRVHGIHHKIRGAIDEHVGAFTRGTRYRANDEEALFWVQATLLDTALQVYELLIAPVSDVEKFRYYEESRRFSRLFGIPESVMPADYRAFRLYMDRMFASQTLAVGRPALAIRHFLFQAPRPLMGPMASFYRTFTAGLMPPRLRTQFELPFGWTERALYQASIPAIRLALRGVPRRLRYFPAYIEATQRLRGEPPHDRVGRTLERWALRALTPSPDLLSRPRRA